MTREEAMVVKEQMIKYGFHAPDITVTEFIEDLLSVKPQEPKTDRIEYGTDGNPYKLSINNGKEYGELMDTISDLPSVTQKQNEWIPVSERLPETDNKNSMNNYNVLLWVKDKNEPEDGPQIYLGKLRKVNGDDGSHNFWGIKIEPCDWTIWGWSYFHEPEVIAWMPLPKPYEPQERRSDVSERELERILQEEPDEIKAIENMNRLRRWRHD